MSQPTNSNEARPVSDANVLALARDARAHEGLAPRTIAASTGIRTDKAFRAVIPPLHLSVMYHWDEVGKKPEADYSRTNNPTRAIFAKAVAELEGGAGAVIVSSGMAAVDLVFHLLKADDLVVAPHDCYGGTRRLLNARAKRGDLYVEFANFTDPASLDAALAKGAKLVLIETPSNPLLRITDLAEVTHKAHAAGALVAVDNTFLSPVLQRPLDFGADFVIHSTTKYLNGHSDVVGGAVVARDPAQVTELAWWANCIGSTASPFDSWLSLRGLRTLHLRVQAQEENARLVAEALDNHPAVEKVYYPGLASHPGHEIAARQQQGFGAILSFELKGGYEASKDFLESLSIFSVAASVGGVESLACHPWSVTHAGIPEDQRREAGITEGLIRLSLGVEDPRDILADLAVGLRAAEKRAAA
ncbi:MAG: cystathionine gamma-synthase [Pseudomonadota bacterium]|nr:cystathionine gamma-synthase [Pseudomonadota bacterium]